jgi:YegS/Rv2252/BmrU family lipid kinase
VPVVGERAERAAVVVNPTKVADLDELQHDLTATMTAAGWGTPLWLPTTAADPGYGMTQRALDDGVTLVVACGGDGTVRVVLTVLAGSGIPIGIVPTGTGNLLARNLGLPLGDPQAALRIALTGVDRAIDVARIEPGNRDQRPERFAVMAGVGFDAAMMRDAPRQLKTRMGWAAYLVSAAKHLRDSSMRVQVRIDQDEPIRARARTVVIGNVSTLPGGLQLLPDARPDDGVLDVAIIISHSLTDWARILARVLTHHAGVDARYSTHRGKTIDVTTSARQPRQIDGDLIADSDQLTAQIEAAALLVRVPTDPTSTTPEQDPP